MNKRQSSRSAFSAFLLCSLEPAPIRLSRLEDLSFLLWPFGSAPLAFLVTPTGPCGCAPSPPSSLPADSPYATGPYTLKCRARGVGDGSLWNDAGDLHFNGDQGLEPWTAGPLQRRSQLRWPLRFAAWPGARGAGRCLGPPAVISSSRKTLTYFFIPVLNSSGLWAF